MFKQKTAYEIEYGLVGSEMCIRARRWTTDVDPKASLDERDSFRESLRLSDTSTALATHGRGTVSDPPPPPPPLSLIHI